MVLRSRPAPVLQPPFFWNNLSSKIKSRKPAIKRPARHQWHYCNPDYDPMEPLPEQPLPPYASARAHTKNYRQLYFDGRPEHRRRRYKRMWMKNMAIADQRWRQAWERRIADRNKTNAKLRHSCLTNATAALVGRNGFGNGQGHVPIAAAAALCALRIQSVRRAGPRRSLPRCWATIPVPESEDVVSDLGWPTTFSQHYVKGKLIGQGSFGSVYLGIDLHNGSEVAIKVMPKQRGKLTRERTLQKLMKEEQQDHGELPERAVALIAYEVLQVVEKCHELGILHGDVKPANFVLANRTKNPLFSKDINLLFGEPWLLAIDFGCSQYLGHMRFSKRTGTPVYMAPEIFDRDYHWEADMWSLGIMLYQLYARRFPYWRTYEECRHAKLDEVAVLVAESPLPMDYGPWITMSGEGIDFMRGCLQRDYSQRMTVSQALNHPWLMQWLPEDVSEDDLSLDLSLEGIQLGIAVLMRACGLLWAVV
eukprot:gene9959-10114_t